jgi:hypothetical protein
MRELAIPAVNSRRVLSANFALAFAMIPKMLTEEPDPLLSHFGHRMVFGARIKSRISVPSCPIPSVNNSFSSLPQHLRIFLS